jgi:hypothetical protein
VLHGIGIRNADNPTGKAATSTGSQPRALEGASASTTHEILTDAHEATPELETQASNVGRERTSDTLLCRGVLVC